MVKIELDANDPNLLEADAILEKREAHRPRRWYLGMSAGGYCARKNYYGFRGVTPKPFTATTLKNFDSGHRAEPVMIERIRQVPDLQVISLDPDSGRQIEVSDFDGHFLGHLDFEILGLKQAPKTWHVGECKETTEKKLAEFRRVKARVGEKNTLKEWNEPYYAQHQLYMRYRRRKRGWLVVASAGVRDWDAVRTDFNRADADMYMERARQIIEEPDKIPDRISEDPSYFMCKYMCEFSAVCHEGDMPERNCRTCAFGKPYLNKAWRCLKNDKNMTIKEQRVGCNDQRYMPALVSGSVIEVTDNAITYQMNNRTWTDEGA